MRNKDKEWCTNWSFNAGFLSKIKIASTILLLWNCESAAGNASQVNLWEVFSIKCSAGFDFPAGSLCSYQRTLLFLFVSPM